MDPLAYCREKVAQPGSSLHYALLFAPHPVQDHLLALHAFAHEVTSVAVQPSDPGVARMKLGWWQDELAGLFEARPRHPVSRALAPAAESGTLNQGLLEELIAGVGMDLEYGAYPSLRELSVYCHRVGGSIAGAAVRVCGAGDSGALRYAHDLGMACSLTARLRRLRPDLESGRLYVPEDELAHHGLERSDLLAANPGANVAALLDEQAARADGFFRSAWQRLAQTQRQRLIPVTVHARLRQRLLATLRRSGTGMLQRRYHLTPLRKLLVAWQTARSERRIARHPEPT